MLWLFSNGVVIVHKHRYLLNKSRAIGFRSMDSNYVYNWIYDIYFLLSVFFNWN